jgi:aminoglycoside 6'-N-acetyltransferase
MEVVAKGVLSWRPLTAEDLPVLADWLREPQVARWWNHETTPDALGRDFGASTRGEEPGEDLLVSLDGRPIGLLQRSVIRDYPEDLAEFAALIEVPDGAIMLDYLIGDAALRGHGLGSRMIAAAVEDTLALVPRCGGGARRRSSRERRVVACAREGGSATDRRRRNVTR